MSYSSEVLADAPLVYYRFNEPTAALTAEDSSGNGRTGTWQGASQSQYRSRVAGLLAGDADGAVSVSGVAAGNFVPGVAIPGAAWMNVSTYTLEALIQVPSATAAVARSIIDRDPSTSERIFQFRLETTGKLSLIFWTPTAGPFTLTSTATLTANTTYHVAATYDGTTARLYVNGTASGTLTQTGGARTSATARLGFGFNAVAAQPFVGTMDEGAVYGTALSAARIAAHYNAAINPPPADITGSLAGTLPRPVATVTGNQTTPARPYAATVLTDSPLGYWRLAEPSGTVLVDSTNNERNGTYEGSPTLGSQGVVPGNTSVTFDGVDDGAVVPYAAWQDVSQSFSVECWFRTTDQDLSTAKEMISRWTGTTPQGPWALDLPNTNTQRVRFLLRIGTTSVSAIGQNLNPRDGKWHHAVGTYDGTAARLYFDGALVATVATTGSVNTTTAALHIGRITTAATPQRWNGGLDEAAYYGTVLSPERVTAHYLAGAITGQLSAVLAGPSASLAGTALLPSADGALAAVAPRPVAEITATYVDPPPPIDGALDGFLPAPTVNLAGEFISAVAGSMGDLLLQLPVLDLAGVFLPENIGLLQAELPQPVGSLYVLVTTPWTQKPKRWVLRDPVRDETWTFPVNPNKMTSPHSPRSFNILATAPSVTSNGQSRGGFGRVIEGNPEPYEWSFSGYIREEDHFESLLYWTRKVNRLELTDHLGRTWRIRFLVFNPDEQRPTTRHPWRFNYEIKTINYGAIA